MVPVPTPQIKRRLTWLPGALLAGFVATGMMTTILALGYAAAAILGSSSPRAPALLRWMWAVANNTLTQQTHARFPIAVASHFVAGISFALSYAAWVEPRLRGPAWRRGLLFSLAPWVLSLVVFLPALGGGPLGLRLGAGPVPILGSLILHLVYGAALGQTYGTHRRIKKLNEDLQDHVRELDAATKELAAFSYSISHDLRSPLRAIDGFSRILLEEHAPELSGEASRYVRLVRENTQRMGQLVDALLDFAHLDRQALTIQLLAPGELVRQAIEELKADQEGRRVKIQVGDLAPCGADPTLLRQVYVNLLANALKFTRHREVAVIEVGCQGGDGLRTPTYFVKDNGAGFEMRYADKLFGVFQRLHRQEDYEGTGIGLATVKRIVERHGGRIWADAEPDGGATFWFTLGSGNERLPSRRPACQGQPERRGGYPERLQEQQPRRGARTPG